MPTGFFIWGCMYPFTFIFGGAMYPLTLHLRVQRKLTVFSPRKVGHHAVFCKYSAELAKTFFFCLTLANNPYLMVRSRSEYYTSMSVSGLPTFLISVKNMNLLSSSIYKHLKTYLIKHKQSLILGECGSQLISVHSNIFQF